MAPRNLAAGKTVRKQDQGRRLVKSDSPGVSPTAPDTQQNALKQEAKLRPPHEAAALLAEHPAATVAPVLLQLNPGFAQDILAEFPAGFRFEVMHAAPPDIARQWERNLEYPQGSVGRLMEPAYAVFRPGATVGDAIERLRALVRTRFITYGYVTDAQGRLLGVITMRDLLFSNSAAALEEIMLREVFLLRANFPLAEAMRLVLDRHYPVYPVCDDAGVLIGLVRGQAMFEEQAIEITAQVGTMVGVEKEERLATPFQQSLRFRHPWLQLNLLTAFIAGAVVGIFQDTVDRLVILAVFLPVLAGQSGNTGCQALAVTLRGLTLGELKAGKERALVVKEASLGLMNGALVGLVAAVGMYVFAAYQQSPNALLLAVVVWLAMVGSCVASGISGAMVPLTLKRLGADPATASSIFLTTATDVVSMGLLLGLASILIR
ncbi:MAG: magnesium transporter [Betaproteobacteria bacterium]|nr:magnesium transporter [Betaproteobacteria bacterium]